MPPEEGLHNRQRTKPRRVKLRHNLTPAEATLWTYLKKSQLAGRKFRRQHSIGPYIVDFYCIQESLAVELDGEVHHSYAAIIYDYKRRVYLEKAGIKVIRFENFLVFDDIEHVLHRIQNAFGWSSRRGSTTPSSEADATPPIQEGSF